MGSPVPLLCDAPTGRGLSRSRCPSDGRSCPATDMRPVPAEQGSGECLLLAERSACFEHPRSVSHSEYVDVLQAILQYVDQLVIAVRIGRHHEEAMFEHIVAAIADYVLDSLTS